MNAFTSPVYTDTYTSSYAGPTVLEGYMKKKRNKDKQLSSEKTADKFFRISFEEKMLYYKPNRNMKGWRRQIAFESFLKFFANVDKEDKKICDWQYGFQLMTRDNKYVFFCKEEEEHYQWVRMLGFIIHKKDLGSFDNYKKKFRLAVQAVQKEKEKPALLVRSTSIIKPYENGIIYADKVENSFINNNNEVEINVNEKDNVMHINVRKSKIGNSGLGLFKGNEKGIEKVDRIGDISNILPKSPPPERKSAYNEVHYKYKLDNKETNVKEKNIFVNNLNQIPETKTVKDNDLDFDDFLADIVTDKRLTNNLTSYKNKKENLNDTFEIGNLLNYMQTQPKEKNQPSSNNFNKPYTYNNSPTRVPNFSDNKYKYTGLVPPQHETKTVKKPEVTIKSLLNDGGSLHIKKDLYGEKIQIENLHCGIDDMSEVNIDKKNSWVGHLPIKSLNKIGFKEEQDKSMVRNFINPFKKKKNQFEIGNTKVSVKSGDKMLDVDKSIIGGDDDNSWVLNFKIKEQR
jgi:hypothetical protein